MAIASQPTYTDPGAIAGVLGMKSPESQQMAMNQLGPSPENQAIAGGIAEGGLGSFLAQGSAPAAPTDPTERPSLPDTVDSIDRIQRMEVKSQWLMDNQNERVPWDREKTWGQYLEEKYTAAEKDNPGSGPDIVDKIIDQQLEAAPPPVEPAPMPPAMPPAMPPPGLPAAPGGPESRMAGEVPPGAGAGGVPVVPTEPMPEDPMMNAGIMGAARGGLVRGYAQGGVVGEQEFLDQVGMLADQAGIPAGDMEAVADIAAEQTAGGSFGSPDEVMDTGIMQTVEAAPADETDLTGIGSLEGLSSQLIDAGEEGLAHVSEGEIVIPYMELSPDSQRMVIAALETGGIDPNRYTVGNDANVMNEMTGLPAFGFFSKIRRKIGRGVKKVGKFLKRNAGTILGIAGALTGQPWMAALGTGIGTLIEGKGIKQALVGAAMSYVGSRWVGPWIGEKVGAGLQYFGANIPTGEVLQKVTTGGLERGIGDLTTQGLANQAAYRGATNAAAETMSKMGVKAGEKALIEAGSTAAKDALLNNAVVQTFGPGMVAGNIGVEALSPSVVQGITDTATNIGQDIAGQMVQGASQGFIGGFGARAAPTAASLSTVAPASASAYLGPTASEGFVEAAKGYAANVAATPIGDLAGRTAGSYMTQAYGTPMVKEYLGMGIPNPDDVLDEWNKRYSYTPTGQQLYTFYTDQYVPNQQVDPNIIVGTPGYPISAAQGGYIGGFRDGGYVKGIGGPTSDENLARLSDGEFVFTEAAVRGAGEGDRLEGARRMYDMMNNLEQRTAPSYAHGGLHRTRESILEEDLLGQRNSYEDILAPQKHWNPYIRHATSPQWTDPAWDPAITSTSSNIGHTYDPNAHLQGPRASQYVGPAGSGMFTGEPGLGPAYGLAESLPGHFPSTEVNMFEPADTEYAPDDQVNLTSSNPAISGAVSRSLAGTSATLSDLGRSASIGVPLHSATPAVAQNLTENIAEWASVPIPQAQEMANIVERNVPAEVQIDPGTVISVLGRIGYAIPTPLSVAANVYAAAKYGIGAFSNIADAQNTKNLLGYMGSNAPAVPGNWLSNLFGAGSFENITPESWQNALETSMADPEAPGKGDVGGMYENWLNTAGARDQYDIDLARYRGGEIQREKDLLSKFRARDVGNRFAGTPPDGAPGEASKGPDPGDFGFGAVGVDDAGDAEAGGPGDSPW